jgi:hypothetical protein
METIIEIEEVDDTEDVEEKRYRHKFIDTECLKSKSQETWLEEIELVPDYKVRCVAGRIVWWDFISTKQCGTGWNKLDKYVQAREFPEVTTDDIVVALLSFGYSMDRIKYRLKGVE